MAEDIALRSHMLPVALLDPRGRCNRKGLLVAAMILLAVEALAGLGLLVSGRGLLDPIALAVKGIVLWAAIAAAAQRLHDIGRTAWMLLWGMLAWIALAFVAGIAVALVLPPEKLAIGQPGFLVVLAATTLPAMAALLWLHLAAGEPRANRYGPMPDGLGFSRHRDRARDAGSEAVATAA